MIPGERIGVSLTGGFSFVTALDEGGMGFMIESTLLSGGIKHFFEPGVLLYFEKDTFWPMVRIGYRYQGLDGFSVLPAVSVGYSF